MSKMFIYRCGAGTGFVFAHVFILLEVVFAKVLGVPLGWWLVIPPMVVGFASLWETTVKGFPTDD